jgi:CRP-like cAMP-binding protein
VIVAKLSRYDYLQITNSIEKQIYKTLKKPSRDRTEKELNRIFKFMSGEAFFETMRLDGMRRQCCKAMVLQRVGAGETLFYQGDRGDTFHIVIRGIIRVIQNGSTVNQIEAGASFGEVALLAEKVRKRSF